MTKNHKQKKVTSIILKFKTPQCINFYRRAVCPDHWSLVFSCNLPSLELKVDHQKMYLEISELNQETELEFNIIIEKKVLGKDEHGNNISRHADTSYAVRVPKSLMVAMKINGEEYWNFELRTFVKVFKGEKYHLKDWYKMGE